MPKIPVSHGSCGEQADHQTDAEEPPPPGEFEPRVDQDAEDPPQADGNDAGDGGGSGAGRAADNDPHEDARSSFGGSEQQHRRDPPFGDAAEPEDGKIPDATKAMVSARRAAWRGEGRHQALARIRKQWPGLNDPGRVVDDAFAWYERYRPGAVITLKGITKAVTSLQALNSRFALLTVSDNPACIVLREDSAAVTKCDFDLRLSGTVVCVGINADGEPSMQPASKVWRESAAKHAYRFIAFTSSPVPESTMNLFRGFGVPAKQGSCYRIKAHIFEVICAGNEQTYDAMLNLIAWQLQNIGRPSRIIVVLVSEQQQTGKGTLLEAILAPIFGRAGLVTVSVNDVVGNFNEVLRGKAFVGLDEALFAGDRRAADHIKGLAATSRITLNAKFLPHCTVPAGLNVWVSSNHEVPVFVEEKDARYWPLRVSEHRFGAFEYWAALYREIEYGGREAFLWEMLNRDVSGFLPQRDVPRKNAVWKELVRAGVTPADPRVWLEESLSCERLLFVCLTEGPTAGVAIADIGNSLEWKAGEAVASASLWAGYQAWAAKRRGFGIQTARINDFWAILTRVGFAENRTGKSRRRVVPDPGECQRKLSASYGGDGVTV